jgi:ElaA protein
MCCVTTIRGASFDELDAHTGYLLWQLRQGVFVVEQECFYLDLDGRDLEPSTRHLWVEEDGQPVAYLRILAEPADSTLGPRSGRPDDPRGETRIGRVLVAQDHRGKGLAGLLMKGALDEVGDRPCRVDAQSYLVGWYRTLGFEPSGEEFLEDGIPHVPMRRTV